MGSRRRVKRRTGDRPSTHDFLPSCSFLLNFPLFPWSAKDMYTLLSGAQLSEGSGRPRIQPPGGPSHISFFLPKPLRSSLRIAPPVSSLFCGCNAEQAPETCFACIGSEAERVFSCVPPAAFSVRQVPRTHSCATPAFLERIGEACVHKDGTGGARRSSVSLDRQKLRLVRGVGVF